MPDKSTTILIVEDEPAIRSIFQTWLEGAGYRVMAAEHGFAALDIVSQHQVDLVISDMRMPIMDGITLARNLKEMVPYRPKILFVSGFSDITDREAYSLGIEKVFSKPVRRAVLLAAIQNCLADLPERWGAPVPAAPRVTLTAAFESVEAARRDGMIAFGQGGLCVRSSINVALDELIGLRIEFGAECCVIAGQGVVRWAAFDEGLIGIEIASIEPAEVACVVSLSQKNATPSFIPKHA